MLQLSQRPLTASGPDAQLFVDRTGETRVVSRALELGFNVLILGDPKSGRTSFLHHLERTNAAGGRPTAFVDAQPYSTPLELIGAVRVALGNDRLPQPDPGSREVLESDLEAVAEATRVATTIFVDNLPPAVSVVLFGRFRDVLWQWPHQWVVGGSLASRSVYLQAPADAFFDTVVELDQLTREDARRLLEARVDAAGDTDDAIRLRESIGDIVSSSAERTPGALLAAARRVVLSEGGGADSFRELAEMQRQAARLGRAQAMLFSELESLGPVHAGDERLLRRLGYTRPRIVQLLKDLESEGIVKSRREGRRQIYSLALPERAP